ncbi:hypothetical protein K5713_04245 [Trueperella pyogenes]|uniref:hypothetical protein n=1 Tax=Trueperella pyogenes TaxID=1661 RepID=UPI00216920F2|nr:hypothetical protein [Trueperella pyogenes]UVJ54499.1 hypothetical protein K5713_04245 [Trueperella pyogenes]
MNAKHAYLRAKQLKTGHPSTRQGQAIFSLHQCLIGATTALERSLHGTIWQADADAYGDFLRETLERANELVMEMELAQ